MARKAGLVDGTWIAAFGLPQAAPPWREADAGKKYRPAHLPAIGARGARERDLPVRRNRRTAHPPSPPMVTPTSKPPASPNPVDPDEPACLQSWLGHFGITAPVRSMTASSSKRANERVRRGADCAPARLQVPMPEPGPPAAPPRPPSGPEPDSPAVSDPPLPGQDVPMVDPDRPAPIPVRHRSALAWAGADPPCGGDAGAGRGADPAGPTSGHRQCVQATGFQRPLAKPAAPRALVYPRAALAARPTPGPPR